MDAIGTDTHTKAVAVLAAAGKTLETCTAAEYVAACAEYETDIGLDARQIGRAANARREASEETRIRAHRVVAEKASEILEREGHVGSFDEVAAVFAKAETDIVAHAHGTTEAARARIDARNRLKACRALLPRRAHINALVRLHATGNKTPSDADVLLEAIRPITRAAA